MRKLKSRVRGQKYGIVPLILKEHNYKLVLKINYNSQAINEAAKEY